MMFSKKLENALFANGLSRGVTIDFNWVAEILFSKSVFIFTEKLAGLKP